LTSWQWAHGARNM